MIVLFTDFGHSGPYVGQMEAVLSRDVPGLPVIDLFQDVPAFEPMLAAYLLAAYVDEFPAGTVFLCVVDPGVGSTRRPAILRADGRWFVGPDNGLFDTVARRATESDWWEITWRPEKMSASFHGRDLFAPVAAKLAAGAEPPGEARDSAAFLRPDWPDDLARIVYIDHFGNAMTGTRASTVSDQKLLDVNGHTLSRARTFFDMPWGEAFWYENANGLAEIAVSQGRADRALDLTVGTEVAWTTAPSTAL